MKLPWVSRKWYLRACETSRASFVRYIAAEARVQELERELAGAYALRSDEQWRRIKAEGEVKYRDERIKRVIGLIVPASTHDEVIAAIDAEFCK